MYIHVYIYNRYHVHEKALLHAAVPFLFVAHVSPEHAHLYRFLVEIFRSQLATYFTVQNNHMVDS